MANLKDIRPTKVVMELGGKERELKFDLNAFAELETRFGTVEKAMDSMQKGGMRAVKTILWVGLIHDEVVLDENTGEPIKYNITPYTVGSWITMDNLEEVSKNLSKAMGSSLPEQKATDVLKIESDIPSNLRVATVILTPEEKAQEIKNG